MKTDPLSTHQMDQALAALSASTGMALAVYRGAVEAGATPQETHRLLVAFFDSLFGKGPAQ